MTWKQTSRHLGVDELERYSRGAATEELSERLEEHLLVCEECAQRLDETDRYVKAVTGAAIQLRRERRGWLRHGARIAWPIAACIALMAGGLLLRNAPVTPIPAVNVALEATRGAADFAQGPAKTPLDLRPDLAGLPAFDRYVLELVSTDGVVLWEGSLGPAEGQVRMVGRPAGAYFLRVFSPSRQLLREYSLHLGQ